MNEQMEKPLFTGDILVCEDNNMIQELIHGFLIRLGFRITMADNGAEGLKIVKNRIDDGLKAFDLIFMDIFMPEMNGLDASDEICKLKTGSPVVALTANSEQADLEQYEVHGMHDCLNKPFTFQELLNCLDKYFTPIVKMPFVSSEMSQLDMLGDNKLKMKLLNNFIKNYNNILNEIEKAINDGYIKLAHRLVHTLKSSAGLIGKEQLQNTANEVEKLLVKEENKTNKTIMDSLRNELDTVLEELKIYINENTVTEAFAADEAEIPESEKINALFNELEYLLDGGDIRCLELIDKKTGVSLRSVSGLNKPVISDLIQKLEDLEFDAAMKILAHLKSSLPSGVLGG